MGGKEGGVHQGGRWQRGMPGWGVTPGLKNQKGVLPGKEVEGGTWG